MRSPSTKRAGSAARREFRVDGASPAVHDDERSAGGEAHDGAGGRGECGFAVEQFAAKFEECDHCGSRAPRQFNPSVSSKPKATLKF